MKKSCVTACPVEWPDGRGISGRMRVEWVAGSPWNRWSDAHGMGGQMTVESALISFHSHLLTTSTQPRKMKLFSRTSLPCRQLRDDETLSSVLPSPPSGWLNARMLYPLLPSGQLRKRFGWPRPTTRMLHVNGLLTEAISANVGCLERMYLSLGKGPAKCRISAM